MIATVVMVLRSRQTIPVMDDQMMMVSNNVMMDLVVVLPVVRRVHLSVYIVAMVLFLHRMMQERQRHVKIMLTVIQMEEKSVVAVSV